MRTTRLWSPSIGNFGDDIALSHVLISGIPHRNTSTLRIAHGVHALITCARLYFSVTAIAPALRKTCGAASASRVVLVQTFFGCQILRNSASAPMEQIAAITSTSHGP